MTYSAIMNELINEVIDEAVTINKSEGLRAPPGAAYSCAFTAQYVEDIAWMGDCAVDPDA